VKLTKEAAFQIRQARARGASTASLAFMYGVSHESIRRVLRGETWAAAADVADAARESQERLLQQLGEEDAEGNL
jgi:hypothetical protein